MTRFLTKVVAKGTMSPYDDVLDLISRKYFKGDGTDVYIRFTNSKTAKPVKDVVDGGPDGVIVYPALRAAKQAGEHRYVQIFDTTWTKVLDLSDIKTDQKALALMREIADADAMVGMTEYKDSDLKATKAAYKNRHIKPTDSWSGPMTPAAWFMTFLRRGLMGNIDDRSYPLKRLLRAGYEAILDDGDGLLVDGVPSSMIYLKPSAYKFVALLDRRENATPPALTPEEDEVLARYTPKWDDKEREPLNKLDFVQQLPEMAPDDVAWQVGNSKHAQNFEVEAQEKIGFREGGFLMMMNPSLPKSTRTSIAEYMLDKAGVSFVGGANLNTFIAALAKKGMVDGRILRATEEDALTDAIYYGKITDPEELRKIDAKEYGHQLAHNPHTPFDVLQKVIKLYYRGDEMEFSGYNPRSGGKAGVDFKFGFKDAFRHPNFPTVELLKIYEKWKKKYPEKGALRSAESELLSREDLPQDLLKTLLKDHEDDLAAPPDSLPAEELTAFWKKLVGKHKAELKGKDSKHYATAVEYGFRATASHKGTTEHVLREILDWKERKDEDGHVIGAILDGKKAAYKTLRDRKILSDDEVVKKVKEKLKFDGPNELLVHFGEHAWVGGGSEPLKFKKVSDSEKAAIEKEMRGNAAHDEFTFEVVEAFKLDKQLHKEFPAYAKKLGNVQKGLYHGTSLANAAGILATGVNVAAKERTGAMFGNGFYLASSSSKAVQYASDNFSHEGFGIVFRLDAVLGNTATWKWGRPKKDELRYRDISKEEQKRIKAYAKKNGLKEDEISSRWHLDHDSVSAKAGMALLHDEYVVKSGQQISIDTVIIVRKEKVK